MCLWKEMNYRSFWRTVCDAHSFFITLSRNVLEFKKIRKLLKLWCLFSCNPFDLIFVSCSKMLVPAKRKGGALFLKKIKQRKRYFMSLCFLYCFNAFGVCVCSFMKLICCPLSLKEILYCINLVFLNSHLKD